MIAYIWLFGIALGIFLTIIGAKGLDKEVKKERQQLDSLGILRYDEVIHLYGHPYIDTNSNVFLAIGTDDNLHFYKTKNDMMSKTNEANIIPISELTRYELKTESEIQKDVTLGRLLVLGVFAFGAKKKKEINNSYLVLSYIQNGVPIDCIFKNAYNNQQLGDIISTINRLKIEQNSQQNNVIAG